MTNASLQNLVIVHFSASAVYTVVSAIDASQSRATIKAVGIAETDSFAHGRILHRERLLAAVKKSLRAAEEMVNMRIFSVALVLDGAGISAANGYGKASVGVGNPVATKHMVMALAEAKKQRLTCDDYAAQVIMQRIWLDAAEHATADVLGRTDVDQIQVGYHLFMTSIASANELYALLQTCDVAVDEMIMARVAGAQYSLMPEERDRGVLFLDIGAKSTNFCLYKEETLLYSGSIGQGGDSVTRTIANKFGLSLNEAERLKRQSATLLPSDADKAAFIDATINGSSGLVHGYLLAQAVQAGYEAIFAEIEAHLARHHIPKEAYPSGIVLAGGGAKIRDLVDYLKKSWQVPVHKTNQNTEIVCDAGLVLTCQDRRLQTALGAVLYFINDNSRHQRRSHDETARADEIGWFGGFAKWVKRLF